MSLKKIEGRGFTVVELFIVFVVIAILGTLIFTYHNSIQEKNRDTTRKNNIDKLEGQLETYNAATGNFPTLANINDPTWRASNMKGFSSSNLQDPKGSSEKLVSVPARGAYSYAPTPFGCDNSTVDCTGFTLTASLESGRNYAKQNLQ